ncbi:peptidase S8/S53 domain-containing protein [Mycena sp. CBHHK59/15]|nr:peptidase S8/S53 domain-containing protein [Mycena sp. CBHHK59/15]
MRSSITVCLLSLSLSTLLSPALAQPSHLVLHERRTHIPAGWERHDKLAVDAPNIANLDALLHDVSHPDSPNYGAHWTPQRVAETFAPEWKTVDAVRDWLVNSGFARERIRVSGSRIWVEVNATVAEAEKLLNTEYHVYKHTSGKKHISCTAYHVPAHLRHHIDLITPTLHFTAIISSNTPYVTHPARSATNTTAPSVLRPFSLAVPAGLTAQQYLDLSKCDQHMTPICLRALRPALNSFGIVEYSPNSFVPSDMDVFANIYATDLVSKRPNIVSIDGGALQTTQTGFDWNGESNLDLQYGMALVTGAQPVTLYQTGDQVEGASFNDFLDALDGTYCTANGGDDPNDDAVYPDPFGGYQGPKACGTVTPAKVISTSYSYNEADLTPFYTNRQCNEYAKLGLMGVTFLYSSGDNGVAGNSALCLNADGSQSTSGTRFNPTFPGSCPYITSVGATQVLPGHTVLNPESACASVIYSGGGFSNYFAIPDYQKTQVTSYLANHKPPYVAGQYNSSGTVRAFPDLSANGANYVVAVQGQFYLVFGTSASAPVVGAILTLVNDARLNAGKSPIGFINPTIYSSAFASAFNDVTNGNNPGCGTQGFSAVKGWDPVTGLGTPNFPKLMKLWLALP